MSDTTPAFPSSTSAATAGITKGDLKAAVDISSKANAADLTQEIIDRANADIALATAKMDKPTGTAAQYIRGNGTLATFPTIPAAQVQADYTQANSAAVDFIKNKPADFSVGAAVTSSVTLNTAFRPSATRPTLVAIIGSFTALISGGVTLSVQTSATESGTYVEVGVTNLITLLTALSNAKETITVPVPAGHWLKVTATGGTPTVTKVVWLM